MNVDVAKAIGWTDAGDRTSTYNGQTWNLHWRRTDGQYFADPTYTADELLSWLIAERRFVALVKVTTRDVTVEVEHPPRWPQLGWNQHVKAPTLLEALERAVLAVTSPSGIPQPGDAGAAPTPASTPTNT